MQIDPGTDNEDEFVAQIKEVLTEVRLGKWDKSNYKTHIGYIDTALEAINTRLASKHCNATREYKPVYFDLVNVLTLYHSLILERAGKLPDPEY